MKAHIPDVKDIYKFLTDNNGVSLEWFEGKITFYDVNGEGWSVQEFSKDSKTNALIHEWERAFWIYRIPNFTFEINKKGDKNDAKD